VRPPVKLACFDPRVEDPRHALIGTVALLAATVALLFAVALRADETPPAIGATEPQEASMDPDRLLALGVGSTPRVARRVEALRRLEFEQVPEPQISEVARLRRLAERALAKPGVRRKVAAGEAELRLLGLLDADQSLSEVATDATALAAAYYDPRREELFLVGGAVPAGPQLAEFILAHELTHALEDQRFGLPESEGLSDDRVLAESALVEGTATALMGEYAAQHLDPFVLASESAAIEAGAGGELPRFAEAEVSFTYFEGARFVEELIDLGNEWALVDFAFERRLPATTEQIIHPEKYLDDERGVPVGPPRHPGPEWRTVDTGSLGEFGTREVLRAGEAGLGADRAAAGWGGDRYRLFARRGTDPVCEGDCRSTHALGVAWRGDDPAEARELAAELRRYAALALDGKPRGRGGWVLEGGWAAIGAAGDEVGLGLAPDRATATRLAQPPG
jgi:hypothetical protein